MSKINDSDIAAIKASPELSQPLKDSVATIAQLGDDSKHMRNEVDAEIAIRKGDYHALDKHPGLAAEVMKTVDAISANINDATKSSSDMVKQKNLESAIAVLLNGKEYTNRYGDKFTINTAADAERVLKDIAYSKQEMASADKDRHSDTLMFVPITHESWVPIPGKEKALQDDIKSFKENEQRYDAAHAELTNLISAAVDDGINKMRGQGGNEPVRSGERAPTHDASMENHLGHPPVATQDGREMNIPVPEGLRLILSQTYADMTSHGKPADTPNTKGVQANTPHK